MVLSRFTSVFGPESQVIKLPMRQAAVWLKTDSALIGWLQWPEQAPPTILQQDIQESI